MLAIFGVSLAVLVVGIVIHAICEYRTDCYSDE